MYDIDFHHNKKKQQNFFYTFIHVFTIHIHYKTMNKVIFFFFVNVKLSFRTSLFLNFKHKTNTNNNEKIMQTFCSYKKKKIMGKISLIKKKIIIIL